MISALFSHRCGLGQISKNFARVSRVLEFSSGSSICNCLKPQFQIISGNCGRTSLLTEQVLQPNYIQSLPSLQILPRSFNVYPFVSLFNCLSLQIDLFSGCSRHYELRFFPYRAKYEQSLVKNIIFSWFFRRVP